MIGFVNNAVEIINETLLLLCFQLLFIFTDYVEDPELRHKFGYGVLYLIGVVAGLNVVFLLFNLISKIYIKVKQYFARRSASMKIQKKRDETLKAMNTIVNDTGDFKLVDRAPRRYRLELGEVQASIDNF